MSAASTGPGLAFLLGDRFKSAIAAFVRELDPNRDYRGFHEYRVLGGTGAIGFQLQAVADTMPALTGVKVWPEGSAVTVYALGALVLVGFVNGDPSRPFIAFDGAVLRHGDALGAVTLGAYIAQKVPPP